LSGFYRFTTTSADRNPEFPAPLFKTINSEEEPSSLLSLTLSLDSSAHKAGGKQNSKHTNDSVSLITAHNHPNIYT